MSPAGVARMVGWLAALGGGFGALMAYDGTAGTAAAPPSRWPSESPLSARSGRSTLVILLHPGCPCSRASVRELEKILAQAPPESVTPYALVVGPDAERGSLWRSSVAIPGLNMVADREGMEARRFGAFTSGQVVLYDPAGRLVFHGGITPARAHEGDNAGARAVLVRLVDGRGGAAVAPVFGCALREESP